MQLRDKQAPDDGSGPGPNSGAPAGNPSGAVLLRRISQEFLMAADDAINHALSGNSQAFLEANRQLGGQ